MTFAPFDVAGNPTFEPIAAVHELRKRKRRPILVCFRRQTDAGNPYVVPAFWVDRCRKCDCGVLHYFVTVSGTEYSVNPDGTNCGSCFG
jgi:hypothetical protein